MGGDNVAIVSNIAMRVRIKLRDLSVSKFNPFEVLEAINEALRELRVMAVRYYAKYSFTIPGEGDLNEIDDTEWPSVFDDVIIEYAYLYLSDGEYTAKEQAKTLWRQKVLGLLSQFNIDENTVKEYFDLSKSEEGVI